MRKASVAATVAPLAVAAGFMIGAPVPTASAAPGIDALLTAQEMPIGYGGYSAAMHSGEIGANPAESWSAPCRMSRVQATADTRGVTSAEARASRGSATLTTALLSKPVARQLALVLEDCVPKDAARPQRVVPPPDLARYSPALYRDAATSTFTAYVNVRSATVVVVSSPTSAWDQFWGALRLQIAKAEAHA